MTKRRRGAQQDLLGVVLNKPEYRSSEDEDYNPGASRGGPAARRRGAAAAAGPSPRSKAHGTPRRDAGAAAEPDEERLTLSERRRRLQAAAGGGRRTAASTAQQHGAPSAGGDPSAHLPTEVIQRVLQFAAGPTAMPTLVAAACVCRVWRAAAEGLPALWRHMDLSSLRRQPTDAAVKLLAPKRWQDLRSLSLAGCDRLTDSSLQVLAQSCPMLSDLDLSYCTKFSETGLTAALSVMLLRPAGGGAQPLARLLLNGIQVTPRASGIDQLLRQVLTLQSRNTGGPVLQELHMEGCPLLTHQGLRVVCDASVAQRRPLLGALRTLRLTQSAGARSTFAVNIERLQYACPRLEELGLNYLGGWAGWEHNTSPAAQLSPYLPRVGAAVEGAGAAGGQEEAAGVGPASAGAEGEQEAAAAVAAADGEQAGEAAWQPGFPALRVCEVNAQKMSHLTDACLARLIAHSPLLEELDVRSVLPVSAAGVAAALHPAAPLRLAALARGGACCDAAVVELVARHGATLEVVDLSWGGPNVTDASAQALALCPRLTFINLAGTAVGEAGVRALVAAAVKRGSADQLRLDIGSCRSVGREVRQAAALGMAQLQQAFGL